MTTLRVEPQLASAQSVAVTPEKLTVGLKDGREVSVPLAWYPRLLEATAEERNNWQLIGDGEGVHWPDVDEDVSIRNLILGQASGESQRSLKRWLEQRRAASR